MIYLFNSAFRPNYLQNVGRTLFLPYGWTNEYRYRFEGQHPNIDPTKVEELVKAKNVNVLIVFVDRFNNGQYSYHPLRKGKLINCYKNGGRLFFKVKLLEYITPTNNLEFNAQLINIGNLPKLTNNDPQNSNDGFYAIRNSDLTKEKSKYIKGDSAWDKITDDIKNTVAFAAKNNQETVFARLSIPSKNWFYKTKSPRVKKSNTFFKISKGQQYHFNLFYKYPNQIGNRVTNLDLTTNDSIRILSETQIAIDNYTNNTTINFTTKRYIEDNNDNISFKFNSSNIPNPENLIAPNFTIGMNIKEGLSFWIQIAIAIILFGISEIIFSIDYNSISNITFTSIISEITIAKLIGTLLKGLALFWIFRLVGKKIV
jgi:hypothetical protein